MKKMIALALSVLPIFAYSQASAVTLEWCQQKARENNPLVRQYDLIEKTEGYSVWAAISGCLPHLTVSAKATEQSDVTHLSIKIPGITIASPSTEQYQILGEASETLWDGGVNATQEKIARTSADVERRKTDVDLYALRDRVDQLFFGILLLDEQLLQNDLLLQELETNYKRVSSYIDNGIASRIDLDAIRVEQLNAGQTRASLVASEKSFRAMLSRMTGIQFPEGTSFVRPEPVGDFSGPARARPELDLIAARVALSSAQKGLALAGVQPRLSAFVQAGYGNPGLNMLSDEASSFYIYGVRLSWQLDNLYTLASGLGKIDADVASLAVQHDLFSYNQDLLSAQQKGEIGKLRELVKSDDEIILLRSGIKASAEKRLENGTMSVSELVTKINDESLARKMKSLHDIQLLSSEYNLAYTNNYQEDIR